MRIPQELESELAKKNVVLFAGAGLSIGAGLPGWSKLIEPLARATGSPWPSNIVDLTAIHLLNAAQSYENRRGRHALITHLRRELTTTEIRPTKAHQLLSQFPWSMVFTTNYDDLIERAFLNAGRAANVIVDQADIAFWDTNHTQIVKLCGDLARPKSVVVSARDFSTYHSVYPRMTERLRTALEMNTALFLGYSLQDPFFNQIWDRITIDFGSLQRVGYAVFFDASALEIDDLHHRNMEVISLETNNRDRTDVLANWLIELLEHYNNAVSGA